MNRLFVHNIWFRLLSPFFSGILIYLLILMINDAVLSIQDDFLSQELYVCIGLSFLTQEFSRLLLIIFERVAVPKSFVLRLVLQVVFSMLLTVLVVSLAMYLYFKYVLLYTPNYRELYIFNSIYSFITLLYVVLYLGHFFLHRRNTKKLVHEEKAKLAVEVDFRRYKKGINPDLLFESLERVLVVMKEDIDAAEDLVDYFSKVYRYILSKRNRELVHFEEEQDALQSMVALFNHLPFRKVKISSKVAKNSLLIPTSLLTVVEGIIRSTISSETKTLQISITESDDQIVLKYEPEERLNQSLSLASIETVATSYHYYAQQPVAIDEDDEFKYVTFPKLNYHESGHS